MLTTIYLASQSPRRQQLLTQIGVPFELLLPEDVQAAEDLEQAWPGEKPLSYVKRVTLLKLKAAREQMRRQGLVPRPILCADTTVALSDSIFGKPLDHADAVRMLTELSGHTHQVFTAVAVNSGRQIKCKVQKSSVTFARLSSHEIQAYVQTAEPMGKAGAYAIQGFAASFIQKMVGSHSGIMGLPLYETQQLLSQLAKDT
jgi:septum formation protein